MIITLMALIFAVVIAATILLKKINWICAINILGTVLLVLITFNISTIVYSSGVLRYFNDLIYIDSLSLIQLLIVVSISLITSIYSSKYIKEELEEKVITLKKAKVFYSLFNLFVLSMIFVAVSNNITAMWIGIEATTLSTAFLIGFSQNKLSLEAAWKYIIICSIGIGLGLMGIVLFIYSLGGDVSINMLNWTYIVDHYNDLNPNIAKIAFVFIFIGIGTKAGLAPMHTWLPDGHSEAPSPISAMMSGILLNLALYVVIRFYIIIKLINGLQNLKYLFIVFGCISLILASFSILKQVNYKRLLAFSSIENIGIVALGIGFGGYVGIFAALLHSIIHAFGKTLLFLVSGNILSAYKTKRIDKIHGLITTMPVNAVFLILGILVITGAPPFASFLSEYKVMIAGIVNGYYLATIIYAICLLLVFASFLNAFIKMIFNRDENSEYKKLDKDKENILPLGIAFGFIVLTSVYFGGYLSPILNKAVLIISG